MWDMKLNSINGPKPIDETIILQRCICKGLLRKQVMDIAMIFVESPDTWISPNEIFHYLNLIEDRAMQININAITVILCWMKDKEAIEEIITPTEKSYYRLVTE